MPPMSKVPTPSRSLQSAAIHGDAASVVLAAQPGGRRRITRAAQRGAWDPESAWRSLAMARAARADGEVPAHQGHTHTHMVHSHTVQLAPGALR